MDSFARAQARHDAMEHPDFYRNDAAEERFEAAVKQEAAEQIKKDAVALASLLAESIDADTVALIGQPEAFAARCAELLEKAVNDYAARMAARVLELLSRRSRHQDDDLTVEHLIAEGLRNGH